MPVRQLNLHHALHPREKHLHAKQNKKHWLLSASMLAALMTGSQGLAYIVHLQPEIHIYATTLLPEKSSSPKSESVIANTRSDNSPETNAPEENTTTPSKSSQANKTMNKTLPAAGDELSDTARNIGILSLLTGLFLAFFKQHAKEKE
ncbi:MAG: hypothetical protein LBI43_06080 [Streptococcaceae bacterium]|jgi:cytoskeletal protein RodZ|nr:hypothetical protein [Streptococcaceae bacterium]